MAHNGHQRPKQTLQAAYCLIVYNMIECLSKPVKGTRGNFMIKNQALRVLSSEAAEMPLLQKQRSLADQAADTLVEAIATGRYQPGEKLIETELAEAFGISRIPLREALKMLEVQGIVVSLMHRGVTVAGLSKKEILEIRQIRTSLETIVAKLVAQALRHDKTKASGLEQIITRMHHLARAKDWSGLNALDIAFHRELCAISGNRITAVLWETLARHARIIFGIETKVLKELAFIPREHEDLLHVLRQGNEKTIEREVAHHINYAKL